MTELVVLTDVVSGQRFVFDPRRDRVARDDAWVTRDGRTIPIGEMETTHIERVIAHLRRRPRALHGRALRRMMEAVASPLSPRSDEACDAFDAEFGELLDAEPREWLEATPVMRALKAELVRRSEPFGVD